MTQEEWTWARWLCRTDLYYLCKVLGFKDVSKEVHGPIVDLLQPFPLPRLASGQPDVRACFDLDSVLMEQTNYTAKHHYKPFVPLYKLEGKRRRLLLYPRGSLKSTINCCAHSIQILLNYPHAALWLCQSNTHKAQDFLGEVKYHFQYNELFRNLFPDYCPQTKKLSEWGTMDRFSIPNKAYVTKLAGAIWHREPSMQIGSIEKSATGLHFDWLKFSDIVDEKNTLTDEQTEKIKRMFFFNQSLVVRPDSWIDVEGTRYHFADVYGNIIDQWEAEKKDGKEHEYDIVVRSCYERDCKDPKFTPDELAEEWRHDESGQRVSIWPERMSTQFLESKRRQDPWVFATQYLNSPSEGSEQAIFPVIKNQMPKWISRHDFIRNVDVAFHTTTVDMAETDSRKADFTVITTCAWSKVGKCYVVDIKRGRFLADEAIGHIFKAHTQYNPISIGIEETGYVRGLMSSIARKRDTTGIYPNIKMLKRDDNRSKTERIANALQPWYKGSDIIFLEDLNCHEQIEKELREFPAGSHDDILDTLADQFQERQYFGAMREAVPQQFRRDLLNQEGRGHELAWEAPDDRTGGDVEDYWRRIGG